MVHCWVLARPLSAAEPPSFNNSKGARLRACVCVLCVCVLCVCCVWMDGWMGKDAGAVGW